MSTEYTENAMPVPEPEVSEEETIRTRQHYESIKKLRFVLMFFVCIKLVGFPTPFGGIVQTLCGFATLAFYIISGYLVLWEDAERPARIRRSIKRSAIGFLAISVVYFIINFFLYRAAGTNIFLSFKEPRLWFSFLVLNNWPFEFGSAVWFVQSLLYAYIIIYFLDKFKLLRFDFVIFAVCLVIAILTGELGALTHLVVPGNFLTRALPYILLGGLIARKRSAFFMVRSWKYALMAIAGVLLMLGEIFLLARFNKVGYYGHLIGMPMLAVPLCVHAFRDPSNGFRSPFMRGIRRSQISLFYYLCQPVSLCLALAASAIREGLLSYISGFFGILTFIICFLIVVVLRMVRNDD